LPETCYSLRALDATDRPRSLPALQLVLTGLAFFRRDLLVDASYRSSFALHAVQIFFGIGAYYFLSRFVDRSALRGADPFAFLLIGLAVNAYMSCWLVCFGEAVRGGQTTGTLKMVFASPISETRFLAFSALYPSARAMIEAGVYVMGGLALGASFAHANLPAAAVMLALSSVAFAALGIASAAVALVVKRGDPFLWVVTSLSWMLGGVFYPTELLPEWLRQAARLLPLTHALSGIRSALLGGAPAADAIAPLVLFALIGLPVSVVAFRAAVRHARITGSLSHV
jgi:ABC-2 type transport system permease protein